MQKPKKILAYLATLALAIGVGLAAAAPATAVPNTIPLTLTNKSGINQQVYIYILGTNLANGQDGWADASGTFHKWPSTGSVPVAAPDASIAGPANGQSLTIQLPKFSGRVYFSYGQKLNFQVVLDGRLVQPAVQNPSDPNRNIIFNWTEYTLNDSGLWINSTQVDFFSAPYQTGLKKSDGSIISTGRLKPDGYQAVINSLNGTPGWNNLIQRDGSGNVLRVLSPGHGVDAGVISANILDDYTNRVWNKYTSQDLVVRPFIEDPSVVYYGRVSGNVMNFRNSSGATVASFNKPSSSSILGCAGDLFAPNDMVIGPIARTLCAGLIRSSALSNPNQPDTNPANYYQDAVTNFYAKYIHQQMVNGKAYAFAFDDVAAQESLVHDGNPTAAYIQLDPFTGAATPIGNEGGGGNNGGGNDGGGNNGGGGTGGNLPAGTGTITATAASNLCVDVPWANPANSTQVQVANCNGGDAQKWTRSGDTIRALGKCLDVRGAAVAAGTPVQIYDCNGTAAQVWKYNATTKALVNPQSGRCLDMAGGSPLHDGQLLIIWDCHGGAAQQWTLSGASAVPTGQVTGLADKCIDVANGSTTTADGTKVQLWTCNGTVAQTWSFHADGTIRNQGKCLDIAAANMNNGTKLQLWTCNGTDAQRFVVQGNQIKSPVSGRCVDVTGNNSASGTQLQMWDCNSGANQRWNVPS